MYQSQQQQQQQPPAQTHSQALTHRFGQTLSQAKIKSGSHSSRSRSLQSKRQLFGALLLAVFMLAAASTTNGKSYMYAALHYALQENIS